MQPGLSFSALLGSIVLALSSPAAVDARPLAPDAGLISMPLTRLHQVRDNVPASVQLQQHANRAHKRIARMTGREAPSDAELTENLRKRMFIPAHPIPGRPGSTNKKRYNHQTQKLTGNEKWTLLKPADGTVNVAVNVAAASTAAGFSADALSAQQKGGLIAANTPTTANTLGLDIEANDVGYIATVQIGTPPKDYKLLMDSGSADLWVGSEVKCANSDKGGDCGTHTFLGPSSSTFADTGAPFAVTYGSGAVAGNKCTDTVVVAGLALTNHSFGVATSESDQFANNNTPFDGLMGLAQSSLSQQKALTPPESLASSGLIKNAIVSYKLSRAQDNLKNGQVTFGGIDPTTIDAKTLVTLPNLSATGFWEAPMTVSVGGKDIGLVGRSSILDTGTTLIVAPPADATALHTQIPGAKTDGNGGFTIPCTTTTEVALTFGGQVFAIDPRDLLFAPVDPNNLTGDCLSGISSGQIAGANEWLVGDVFLKNVVFATDVGKNQVALAKQV